jgi:hypothetical protein
MPVVERSQMSRDIRLEGGSRFADAQRLTAPPLSSEFAEQVKFLAGDPSEGVMWSDVFSQLRGGLNNVRRLLAERGSRAAH